MKHKMMPRFLLHILLFQVGTFHLDFAGAVVVDGVATGEWDGIDFYISVKRDAIQKKLNASRISTSSGCDDGKFSFVHTILIHWQPASDDFTISFPSFYPRSFIS